MTRSLPYWKGKNDDSRAPNRVRLRIFNAYAGTCQITGRKITPQDKWALDHRVALCNGGANEESNLWPVLEEAHKVKTAGDVAEKSAVAARAKKHHGIKGKPTALAGRSPEQKKADRAPKGDRISVPPPRYMKGFVSPLDD